MIQLVPHIVIRPSPLNPRKTIAEEALTELAQSIKAEGLLQQYEGINSTVLEEVL